MARESLACAPYVVFIWFVLVVLLFPLPCPQALQCSGRYFCRGREDIVPRKFKVTHRKVHLQFAHYD